MYQSLSSSNDQNLHISRSSSSSLQNLMEAVLVAMSVPATTEDDGFSLITDKLSYNLTTTSDVEIVTSNNRRIPAQSGVLVTY